MSTEGPTGEEARADRKLPSDEEGAEEPRVARMAQSSQGGPPTKPLTKGALGCWAARSPPNGWKGIEERGAEHPRERR